jgi:DNA-binding PucR family transcriptional regulator
MELAFALTDDPVVLQELLSVSSLSISSFVDVTLTAVGEHVTAARQDLSRGRDAELREVVALVVQGAPISASRASERLRYPVDREHWALVVWSNAADVDLPSLDRVTHLASTPTRGNAPLVVGASTSTRWVWTTSPPDEDALSAALADAPQVYVATAGPNPGVAGFRQSHLDALRTQRLVDGAPAERRLARYEDVALVALASQDPDGARRFVDHQLGALASADSSLRATLRTYLRLHASASATAEATYTHRNTVLRRIERARSLLPDRARDLPVEVAVALDLIEWGVVDEPRPRA